MPVVKRVRKRGSDITVEAHAEVLFAPGGSVDRWQSSFVQKLRLNAIAFAPSNKRPRWAHYGKPLKDTITAARNARRISGRDSMAIYGAVGATAPYAAYVDQGTGVYNGHGAYPAKILPPWTHGGASLYESTWVPPGSGKRVGPVMIKGQPGQFFFDRALEAAFAQMRLTRRFGGKTLSLPSYLATTIEDSLFGNTESTPAFIAQLEEWRAWRDAAWAANRDFRDISRPSPYRRNKAAEAAQRRSERRAANRARRRESERQRAYRNRQKAKAAKSQEKPKVTRQPGQLTRAQDRARVLALANKKFGTANVESVEFENGRWDVVVKATNDKGKTIFKSYHIKAKS